MSTIRELIYNTRNILYNGLGSDDYILSDKQIKHWYNVERNFLLKEKIDKEKQSIPNAEQSLGCIFLECVDKAQCANLGIYSDEYISRTDIIPSLLNTDTFGEMIAEITTVYGDAIEFTTKPIANKAKFKKYTKHQRRAFIDNGRIYILNADNLEIIKVKGIFENPEEVSNFVDCDGVTCYTDDSQYPLPANMIGILNELVFKKYISYMLNSRQDRTNNSNNDNKEN